VPPRLPRLGGVDVGHLDHDVVADRQETADAQ
jgi:hypothetical protein